MNRKTPSWDDYCHCETCLNLPNVLALYMLWCMEPTDRALRLAGDTCPAEVPS